MGDNAKKTSPAGPSGWVVLGGVGTSIWVLFLIWLVLLNHEGGLIERPSTISLNNLGDFLAGIFAPLAFLWLFVAVMVQSQELALQRQELAATREEVRQSREVMKSQADFIGEQTQLLSDQHGREMAVEIEREVRALVFATSRWASANWSARRGRRDGSGNIKWLVDDIGLSRSDTFGSLLSDLIRRATRIEHDRDHLQGIQERLLSECGRRLDEIARKAQRAPESLKAELAGFGLPEALRSIEPLIQATRHLGIPDD